MSGKDVALAVNNKELQLVFKKKRIFYFKFTPMFFNEYMEFCLEN